MVMKKLMYRYRASWNIRHIVPGRVITVDRYKEFKSDVSLRPGEKRTLFGEFQFEISVQNKAKKKKKENIFIWGIENG